MATNTLSIKEKAKRAYDEGMRVGPGKQDALPEKTVKTATCNFPPTISTLSQNEIENLKAALPHDLPSVEEGSPAQKLKMEIEKMHSRAGFEGLRVHVKPWEEKQPDGTKIVIPSRFLVKVTFPDFCF